MSTPTPLDIEHKFAQGRGMTYVPGEPEFRAAMMYHTYDDGTTLNIDHTEVDDSLRGQGVGMKLLEALIAHAKSEGLKVSATCPFAVAMLDKHPEVGEGIVVAYTERR